MKTTYIKISSSGATLVSGAEYCRVTGRKSANLKKSKQDIEASRQCEIYAEYEGERVLLGEALLYELPKEVEL